MRLFFIILFSLSLFACTTKKIILLTPQKPTIELPNDVKNILVINRYTSEKTKTVVVSSNFLYIGGERDLTNVLAEEITKGLNRNEFYTATLLDEYRLEGEKKSNFPDYYTWYKVNDLCEGHYAQLLILIEYANVEIERNLSSSKVIARDEEGNMVEKEIWEARQLGSMEVGIRIYNPLNTEIIDEFYFSDNVDVFATGDTKSDAKTNCPTERDIVIDWANINAEKYTKRISPVWKELNRKLFVKGHDNLKLAYVAAQEKQWDKAVDLWKNLLKNKNVSPKIRSYAEFNLAVNAEREGKLQYAIELAEKSKQLFENEESAVYIRTLKMRLDIQN
jgi:predicted nucleotide-binding protein